MFTISGDLMIYIGIGLAAIGIIGLILTIIISNVTKGKVIDRINGDNKK